VRRKSQIGIFSIILLMVAMAAQLQFTGCSGAAGAKGMSPERQKAIQDSLLELQKHEIRKAWSIGYESHKQQNYEKAARYFNRVLKLDTIGFYGAIKFERLGDTYLRSNKPDSAEWALKQGMELAPEKPYYYRTLGYLYRASQRHEEALTMYTKLTELEPDNAEHFDMLSDVYVSLNDRGNAIQALDKLIALDPNNKAAIEKKNGLLIGGDIDEIIASQLKMVEMEPENTKYRMDLAKTYHGDTRFEKAIEQLKVITGKEPQNVFALELLGDSYKQVENFTDAANTYQRILEITPDNKKNMCNLADSYTSLGRYSRAIRQARKAFPLGQAYLSIGYAYQTAAERCVTKRGGEVTFDDKLVYKMAYDNFKKAAADQLVRGDARRYIDFLKELIPTTEDKFMHKGQTVPKAECYNWIK